MGGEEGLFEVDLVFERYCRPGYLRKVDGVLPRLGGEFGDEGWVRGDFFEDGEIFQADGIWTGAGWRLAGVVDQRQLSYNSRTGDLALGKVRTDGLND